MNAAGSRKAWMRMNDARASHDTPATYRVVDVNRDLARVYHGNDLIGHVRRGLDARWNPELPDERTKVAAIQAVVLAHQAIQEFVEVADGRR